jgi:UDP-GlcNAc3NAcA epimerase
LTLIVTVVGARPQFIKAAAVSRALRDHPRLVESMVHTGQHFDAALSDVFFRELEIPQPEHRLDIHGGPHGQMTGRMLEAVEAVLLRVRPAAVVVYGDTNSTLAGALAAAKLHMPVVHIEAGLRSFNRRMPEEQNRVVTDHLSALLCCPTSTAVGNLAAEGITRGVHSVGDVMYDATLFAGERAPAAAEVLAAVGLPDSPYMLATVHRAENTDDGDRLAAVMRYLRALSDEAMVVLPLHPRTRAALARWSVSTKGLRLIEPLGYFHTAALLRRAVTVVTDSGGLQKEAYFHRVPCVTLRDETEWVETLEAGWNRLWTTSDYVPRREISEYGDGHAAQEVVDVLDAFLLERVAP